MQHAIKTLLIYMIVIGIRHALILLIQLTANFVMKWLTLPTALIVIIRYSPDIARTALIFLIAPTLKTAWDAWVFLIKNIAF